MAKTFKETSGLSSLLGEVRQNFETFSEEEKGITPPVDQSSPDTESMKKRRGRPATTDKRHITKSSQEGLKEGWTRATLIVQEEPLRKLKMVCSIEEVPLKELATRIISDYVEQWEQENGEIQLKSNK